MMPRVPFLGLPSYGLFVALGFIAAMLLVSRTSRQLGFPRRQVEDIVTWAALAGLLGAKALLALLEWDMVRADPSMLLFQGGVFYGGLIAAILTVLVLSLRGGLSPEGLGDACAPALALAHALGRIGCFLAGCCWGAPCDLPQAVSYTDVASAAFQSPGYFGQAVHPVQLYEAVANLALCGLLLLLLRRPAFVGQIWWVYVLLYALARMGLETFRGDPRGTLFEGAVSTSQGIALLAATVAGIRLLLLWRRARLASA